MRVNEAVKEKRMAEKGMLFLFVYCLFVCLFVWGNVYVGWIDFLLS